MKVSAALMLIDDEHAEDAQLAGYYTAALRTKERCQVYWSVGHVGSHPCYWHLPLDFGDGSLWINVSQTISTNNVLDLMPVEMVAGVEASPKFQQLKRTLYKIVARKKRYSDQAEVLMNNMGIQTYHLHTDVLVAVYTEDEGPPTPARLERFGAPTSARLELVGPPLQDGQIFYALYMYPERCKMIAAEWRVSAGKLAWLIQRAGHALNWRHRV